MKRIVTPGTTGFSMVEVLVALIVLSVGLLGIAKMQALGMSSTSVAGKRALAAIQADSLAAAMHENRAWWGSAQATGAWVGAVGGTASCQLGAPNTSAPCTPQQLATYDLQVWAQGLNQLLPNANGSVNCQVSGAVETCTITITWSENTVAINANANNVAASGINNPTYVVFVEP